MLLLRRTDCFCMYSCVRVCVGGGLLLFSSPFSTHKTYIIYYHCARTYVLFNLQLIRDEERYNNNKTKMKKKNTSPPTKLPERQKRIGRYTFSVCGRLIVHRRRQQVLSVRGQRIIRIRAPAASTLHRLIDRLSHRLHHRRRSQLNNIIIIMYCYHWRVIGVRILSRTLASAVVTKLIFHVGVGAVCAQDIILLLLYTVSRENDG